MSFSLPRSLNPVFLVKNTALFNFNGFSLADTPSLAGKIAVITGGQAGIGQEIVLQLLLHGVDKVYILARSEEKYELAKTFWVEKGGMTKEDVANKTEFMRCDLSDVVTVKKVGDLLLSKLERLDILLNNAGRPPGPDYTLSAQGIESIFATNHVGHFVLTNILLSLLQSTASKHGNARIVVTSSSFHLVCRELDLKLLTSPTRTKHPNAFDGCWRYGRSKLANILFTRELAHRLGKTGVNNVHVNCFYPGNISTEAMETWKDLLGSVAGNLIKGTFHVVGQSVADGAATAIYLAASPEVEKRHQNGKYFVPIATEGETSRSAEDKNLAENLWSWTENQAIAVLGKNWEERVPAAVT